MPVAVPHKTRNPEYGIKPKSVKRKRGVTPDMFQLLETLKGMGHISGHRIRHEENAPDLSLGGLSVDNAIVGLSGDPRRGDETALHEIVHAAFENPKLKKKWLMNKDDSWMGTFFKDQFNPNLKRGARIRQDRSDVVRRSIPKNTSWSGLKSLGEKQSPMPEEELAYYLSSPEILGSNRHKRAGQMGEMLRDMGVPTWQTMPAMRAVTKGRPLKNIYKDGEANLNQLVWELRAEKLMQKAMSK